MGLAEFCEPAERLERLARTEEAAGIEALIADIGRLTSTLSQPAECDGNTLSPRDDSAARLAIKPTPEETTVAPPNPLNSGALPRIDTTDPRLQRIRANFVVRLQQKLNALQSAWEHRNFVELSGLAHWLKGSAGTVGYGEFVEPAMTLETCSRARDESGIEQVVLTITKLAEEIFPASDKEAV